MNIPRYIRNAGTQEPSCCVKKAEKIKLSRKYKIITNQNSPIFWLMSSEGEGHIKVDVISRPRSYECQGHLKVIISRSYECQGHIKVIII